MTKTKFMGLCAGIVLACLASSYAAIKYDRTRHEPLGELFHEMRTSSFSPTHVNLVFVGDSITQNGNWTDYFPGIEIANRGILGDTTAGALKNLHFSFETNASRAIVMLGINDILQSIPAQDTIENYRAILGQLAAHGIAPTVTAVLKVSDRALHAEGLNRSIDLLNGQLATLCAGGGYRFLDAGKAMQTDGYLTRDFAISDGIHVSARGYEALASIYRSGIDSAR